MVRSPKPDDSGEQLKNIWQAKIIKRRKQGRPKKTWNEEIAKI